MPTVDLPTYSVTIEPGSLAEVGDRARALAPAHRVAIITDTTVGRLYGDRIARQFGAPVPRIEMPSGEQHKTRATWADLTDRLLAAGFGRDTLIIALGGGVVGDLAGFVAATFLRGVPYLQLPTTLLAMVDAAVGGKTGVDTPAGKNLVGAFHQPAGVLADPEALETLPAQHLRAGLAEMIKHGAIADASYFDRVLTALPALTASGTQASCGTLAALIARSVEIKAQVVGRDEREAGLRAVLNFGHTLGHAIESASGYAIAHGEAVASGMVLEARLAERLGVARRGTAERIQQAVAAAGLPTGRPAALTPEQIVHAARADKKARGGLVRYALPARIGAMAGEGSGWTVAVEDSLVLEVLA